jgi:beta-glucosidase
MQSVEILIKQMTLEEKAAMLEGLESWRTNPVPRLGIPSMYMTDGPHGVRKVKEGQGGISIFKNETSTAFPTSSAVAMSWNKENAYKVGQAIAEECLHYDVDMLLAPGINIKRSPLCGRNFEYFSEDPLITGVFGEEFVKGVQSKGVAACVKHFAANSNEDYRYYGDSVVDERALREIYMRAFERVVKNAKPYTVMCSYNKVNGEYASQKKYLLDDVLREEWGFDGAVISDWGAVEDRVKAIQAGLDLDMPGGVWHNRKSIIEAVKGGTLSLEDLNKAVTNVLRLVEKCTSHQKAKSYDKAAHEQLSCDVAKDSAVLMKNNEGILPLKGTLQEKGGERLLVVGELFEKMRFQGAGSSLINPETLVSPKTAFDNRKVPYTYEKGYRQFYEECDNALEEKALSAADNCDIIIFFGGLTDFAESEGFDRKNMKLPENQIFLLNKLMKKGKKIIFVLFAGSPVELPFIDNIDALLYMGLPGMNGGEAAAALLFGDSNPSGRLAESWIMTHEDSSCFKDYDRGPVGQYYESIYVGYRYYDKAGVKVRFPFGWGLSYTSFDYTSMGLSKNGGTITCAMEVANTGDYDGSEVIQLYVRNPKTGVFKADKELRAFTKVYLKMGEKQRVELSFSKEDLCYYNVKKKDWVLENGEYEVLIGPASCDIRLRENFSIIVEAQVENPYSRQVQSAYSNPSSAAPGETFEGLLGRKPQGAASVLPITIESPLRDYKHTFMGTMLYMLTERIMGKDYKRAMKMSDSLERDAIIKNSFFMVKLMPSDSSRGLSMASGGFFTYNMAKGFAEIANGHLIKGLRLILKKEEVLPLPKDN